MNACLPMIDFPSLTVRGRVFDASCGQALTAAVIMLQRFPHISARIDSNGDFVLRSKTNHTWCVALPDNCLIRFRNVDLVASTRLIVLNRSRSKRPRVGLKRHRLLRNFIPSDRPNPRLKIDVENAHLSGSLIRHRLAATRYVAQRNHRV